MQKFSFELSNVSNAFNLTLKLVSQNCSNCNFGFSNVNLFHIKLNPLDPSQLQKIKIFSSEKEAIQNIEISNKEMKTIEGLATNTITVTHKNGTDVSHQ